MKLKSVVLSCSLLSFLGASAASAMMNDERDNESGSNSKRRMSLDKQHDISVKRRKVSLYGLYENLINAIEERMSCGELAHQDIIDRLLSLSPHKFDTASAQWPYVQGVLAEILGNYRLAFDLYSKSSEQGHVKAKEKIIFFLREPKLFPNLGSDKERFNMLKKHAERGDPYAQEIVISALVGWNTLGQEQRDQEDRKQDLLDCLDQGWPIIYKFRYDIPCQDPRIDDRLRNLPAVQNPDSQRVVNEALYGGTSGTDAIPEEKRLEYLMNSAEQKGDTNAQNLVNKAHYEGDLGLHAISEAKRLKYLMSRAEQGDENAQDYVMTAYLYDKLGLANLTPTEKQKFIEEKYRLGWKAAKERVNQMLYFGELGYLGIGKEMGLNTLKDRAQKGDQDAQRWVDQAHFDGALGLDGLSAQDRLDYLKSQAFQGDRSAQYLVTSHLDKPPFRALISPDE